MNGNSCFAIGASTSRHLDGLVRYEQPRRVLHYMGISQQLIGSASHNTQSAPGL